MEAETVREAEAQQGRGQADPGAELVVLLEAIMEATDHGATRKMGVRRARRKGKKTMGLRRSLRGKTRTVKRWNALKTPRREMGQRMRRFRGLKTLSRRRRKVRRGSP